jgi:hypothetical protein
MERAHATGPSIQVCCNGDEYVSNAAKRCIGATKFAQKQHLYVNIYLEYPLHEAQLQIVVSVNDRARTFAR